MDDIEIVCVPVGAQGGTVNRPLFHVPVGFGGITLTKAYIRAGGASTSVMQLQNLGTAFGTTVSSVIGTLNGTLVANVQQEFLITTAYQAENTWLGLGTGAGGSLDAATELVIEFAYGK